MGQAAKSEGQLSKPQNCPVLTGTHRATLHGETISDAWPSVLAMCVGRREAEEFTMPHTGSHYFS